MTANLDYENLELKKKDTSRRQDRITALPASGTWVE
ncbi:hypothetical protein QFZ74_005673 [Streptomyces sp. V3I7]|nr:hypothetical protein [Streptomyces sp. V3I7]